MITSSGSRSDRQTSRSTKPVASSTRCARFRKAATSSSARSAVTRRRESDTYIGASMSGDLRRARGRSHGIAAEEVRADLLRQASTGTGAADRERHLAPQFGPAGKVPKEGSRGHRGDDDEIGPGCRRGVDEVRQRRVRAEVRDPPAVVAVQRQPEAQKAEVVLLAGRAGQKRNAVSLPLPAFAHAE